MSESSHKDNSFKLEFQPSSGREASFQVEWSAAITNLIHQARLDRPTARTGKPEAPLTITYALPSAHQSFHTTLDEFSRADGNQVYTIHASDFWQHRISVSLQYPYPILPLRRVQTQQGFIHPLRPEKPRPGTLLYRRRVPSLNTDFSLRVVDRSRDLDVFHAWHNSDRVNAFWGERGTRDAHEQYLVRQEADEHVTAVVGEFGGTAFAYFELYWAKEDAIGVHAAAGDWDRGFHALVGDEAHRGPEKVRIWIASVTHHLFLADPRTQRVLLEPRVDNDKFISYLTRHGYSVEKEFNFPHKRAALVSISREKFFETLGVET